MTVRVPFYLCDRDVLHSPALWPTDVRALEQMWRLPARVQVGPGRMTVSRRPKEEEQR